MKYSSFILGLVIGGTVAIGGYSTLYNTASNESSSESNTATAEKKPLYWVAPMDANYRRDKPGKSPMGMDLIPYYGEENTGSNDGPGAIKISSAVVNNLGVRTSTVQYKTLNNNVDTVGYVSYDEDKLIHIHPRVEGWIEKLYVKSSGDPVKKGDALYDIYSPEMVNAQEELVLAIDRKNSRLIEAAKAKLLSLNIPSSTINELEKTKKVKQTVTFYAPATGVVDNLQIRQGFYVKPGVTMMSIGSLEQIWVNAEVFERQANQIKVGAPVKMTLDYLPGKEWSGKVDYIYPTLDEKTRTIKVRLKFENKDELLKPGMFAQINIDGKTKDNALVIPKEALIRSGNSNRVVLALADGKFKSINVKVGELSQNYAEILSGLKDGEKIVTSAQFLLDSESSKTSDFKRMEEVKEDMNMAGMDKKENKDSTNEWAQAKIINLMPEKNKVKVHHSAIENWKWPEMTMKFEVAKQLNFSLLKEDMTIDIEISKTKDNKYIISNFNLDDNNIIEKAWAQAKIINLMPEKNKVKVHHSAIENWKWPEMTMKFEVAKQLNFSLLKEDMTVDIEISKTKDNKYIISNIKL